MSLQQIQLTSVNILNEVISGHNLTDVFECYVVNRHEKQEWPTLKNIIFNVLRKYASLEYQLRLYIAKPLDSLFIKNLLIVAIYQLLNTDTTNYAVVNEAVGIAKKHQHGKYKNLVNAVLRRLIREDLDIPLLIPREQQLAFYNLPEWWVNKLQKEFPKQASVILDAYQQHPPLTLRINRKKCSLEKYLVILKKNGMAAEYWGGVAVHLIKPVAVDYIPYFFEGYVSIQDLGAQRAAELLQPQDGMRVLDACAAPGGKTGHILEKADCKLVALDINAKRLEKVSENLQRLDEQANILCADASRIDYWWDGKPFDLILADVPCTASGVVKRNPDIRWLRKQHDAKNIAHEQVQLLDNLWSCLKNKGKMLIATCSVFNEENQQQLALFLARNKNAVLLTETQLLPNYKHDGFYYALVEKK